MVPAEYAGRADDYVALVAGPMLTACAPAARWVDVFCEPGRTRSTATRPARGARGGAAAGLGLRVHANQLGRGPGVRLAVELERGASTTARSPVRRRRRARGEHHGGHAAAGGRVLHPLALPDARRLLDAGATVALATDCNPGSGYTSSMPFAIALAVREMRMTPAEALWAATAGGARPCAATTSASVRTGARADLAVLDAPSYLHLAYRPGGPLARALDL